MGTALTCALWLYAADKPNVVVLQADDLRADVLSVYGGPVKTPHLDRLARRGVVFRRATCGYPICHVSRTELLSGRCVVKEASAGKAVPFAPGWVLWPEAMSKARRAPVRRAISRAPARSTFPLDGTSSRQRASTVRLSIARRPAAPSRLVDRTSTIPSRQTSKSGPCTVKGSTASAGAASAAAPSGGAEDRSLARVTT